MIRECVTWALRPKSTTMVKAGRSVHLTTLPGSVALSVMCLAADASLTADPGVASLIPARSHTFVEIDIEIIS